MVSARRYRTRRAAGLCTDCGRSQASPGKARCGECQTATSERTAGRVPGASATYWRAREHRWRSQHIMVGERYFDATDYAEAWRRQHGLCGLCFKPLPVQKMHDLVGTGRGISVDHNHHTHQFRALVDTACNIRVSTLNLEWAKRVVEYLQRHEQTPANVTWLGPRGGEFAHVTRGGDG